MLRYVIAIACVVGVSAKCSKSCQKYDCDYWVDELMLDCKTLEEDYSCDCGGCYCKKPQAGKKSDSKSKLVKTAKKFETGVCPVSVWKFPADGFFTYGKSFLDGKVPTKAHVVVLPEAKGKPYEVELPPKSNADVGMIVVKPGAWLIVGEGSVLTSHEPQGCTLSDCSEDKNAAGQKGYDVINDKAVSCKSKDKPVSQKPTTKKPTTPKDCVDYDGDGLCGAKDKCPFSTDNDSDGDDLCELHCTPTPKEMLNRIEAEKEHREFSTRSSGQNRFEDNRPKSLFQKKFAGKMYTCLLTDPCLKDPQNKCKDEKPAVTPKPGKCLDFDDDGVCNKDDKCVFSADNDNDKDDLCEIHCQKQPKGYEPKQKIDVQKEKREFSTRASGQKRVEDNRQSIFKKEFGGETYICLRTDPCPNDVSNSCKPKKDDENKCKDVACMDKKHGDNVCDDGQNKYCCNWDGGDCCVAEGKNKLQYNFCSVCDCLDPTSKPKDDGPPRATVVLDGNFDEVVGKNKDGFLKACTKKLSNNGEKNIECYDVYAGSIILVLQGSPNALSAAADDVQSEGLALEGFPPLKAVPTTQAPVTDASDDDDKDAPGPTEPEPTEAPEIRSDKCKKNFKTFCKFPARKGDKLCDDENNIAGCDWDGGDCCGSSKRAKQYKTCSDCACKDCTFTWKSDACVEKIRGFCQSKGYENDGFCDANNNNAGCDWDGGDCCGLGKGRYQYCKKDKKRCACLDCTYVPKTTPPPACAKEDYKGDGECDDNNNNEGCEYDGGDCCGPDKGTTYCENCDCLDPNYVPPPTKPTTTTTEPDCHNEDHKGDGNCDDLNNKPSCDWDGGDCCGPDIGTSYCFDCDCLDPNYVPPTTTTTTKAACGQKAYKGDGNCDDDNNVESCEYDGGDCCGPNVVKKYCIKCDCSDPNYVPPKQPDCGNKDYKGDGNCDDSNNKASCDYDGGDCCTDTKKLYCTECKCLDPNYKPPVTKPAACGAPDYKGDGQCDDSNNKASCDYDGGDCCGPNKGTSYCTACKCLDPNYKPPKQPDCGNKDYKGDGNCDDSNNKASCDYDGGDCCTDTKKLYCTECKCLDPNYKPSSCGAPDYKGDGQCDDNNNLKACDYDGGDCCGPNKGTSYCSKCACLDPNYVPPTTPKPECGNKAWKGDGNCDDVNNNEGCDYDGGDCCEQSVGGEVKKNYCQDCACLDPKNQCYLKENKCGGQEYKGDGHCDDYNNNCGCDYDGGDCCAASVEGGTVQEDYCSDCGCKDPKYAK